MISLLTLKRIDSIVDDAANSDLLSLLDRFLGYQQIWMKIEDKNKTSFITPLRTYCFIRMHEDLKDAGSTFSSITSEVLKMQF